MPLPSCPLLNIKRSIISTLAMIAVIAIVVCTALYMLNRYSAISGVWIAMSLTTLVLGYLIIMKYVIDSHGYGMFTRYSSDMKKAKKHQSEKSEE